MDTQKIKESTKSLTTDQKPIFGKMTPQHMLEHLIITLKLSSGRINLPIFEPSEEAIKQKKSLLETDMKFPKGIQAPGSNGELPPLKLLNLEEAQQGFSDALEQFRKYFESYPEATPVHPRFGALTAQEWSVFHGKHIAHHFSQFGLTC
jgi:oxepin-CoA hydrolase/3-oxo-5,6-dehydrosuberyl-CoA semialdehyde dehydrogenase